MTVCQYGIPRVGPWLLEVMEIMFWIYIAFSTVISAGLYLTLWSTQYVQRVRARRALADIFQEYSPSTP